MNRRVVLYAALGCGTLAVLLFAALAISGYQLVHSYLPERTPPPIAATEDPHRMVDLISRADLQAVMPAAPEGSHLLAEQYLPNAYCLDVCPTFTRQYDVPGSLTASCTALVAIRYGYLHEGYHIRTDYGVPQYEFPATVHDCRAISRKLVLLAFTSLREIHEPDDEDAVHLGYSYRRRKIHDRRALLVSARGGRHEGVFVWARARARRHVRERRIGLSERTTVGLQVSASHGENVRIRADAIDDGVTFGTR